MRPIIIDEPGMYVTRNGKKVRIYEIKDPKFTFHCHGYLLIQKKTQIAMKWNIWAPDGRFKAIELCDLDIVSKTSNIGE